jgi:hypothetical protein
VCIVVGLILDWTGLVASVRQDPTTAEGVVSSLMQPALGTSVAAWKVGTPKATWRRYRGTLEDILVRAGGVDEPEEPGFDPGGFWCATAMDHAEAVERVVVFYGLRDTHPESPWRIAVLTSVARAYETKWALNGMFTTDGRENARLVTAAEAAARVRAMRLYGEVMRLAPESNDAAYARRRIIQIRANMTTSQDAYSCVIP